MAVPERHKGASSVCMQVLKALSNRAGLCRRTAKRWITYDWFDQVVAVLILINCICLALDNPTEESPPEWQRVAESIFTAAFMMEMSLKLIALGLLYFTDPWNWLDAVVVAEGLFSFFYGGGPSMKSLRVLRVLRPLRTVRRMPRVQLVVTSIFKAGWTLGRIGCIFVVWLTIFAIMGVLLWSGALDMRCASGTPALSPAPIIDANIVCGLLEDDGNKISNFCSSLKLLNSPYTCEEEETCVDSGSGPYSGMVSFDNLVWSMLTLYTVTTLEGWHEVAFAVLAAVDVTTLLHLTPLLCLPSTVGTLILTYKKVMMITQRVMSEYTVWFFVFLIVTATWAIMSLMIAAMLAKFKAVSFAESLRLMQERAKARANKPDYRTTESILYSTAVKMKGAAVRGGKEILIAGPNRAVGFVNSHAEKKPEGKTASLFRRTEKMWAKISEGAGHPLLKNAVLSEDSIFSQAIHWAIVLNVVVLGMRGYDVSEKKSAVLSEIGQALTIAFAGEACFKVSVLGAKGYFKSSLQNRPILPQANITLEGQLEALRNRWNRFDFFVTMIAVLDLIVSNFVDDVTAMASLRLLNILRVFRILRMRRLKRTVMTVVGVVIKSTRDLWPVVALMMLMCFVFTVLGMQLFGAVLDPGLEEYATNSYATKTRFDTFFWSFVQVFTVIAGDNWNVIMYRTMESTGASSAIFFVALMVLGESVLLNLVLAVVLEGASDQMKEKHAAQQFRDKILKLFHNQYKHLAMQRWSAKVQAATMLERGQLFILTEATTAHLGLLDFPRPSWYCPGLSSSGPHSPLETQSSPSSRRCLSSRGQIHPLSISSPPNVRRPSIPLVLTSTPRHVRNLPYVYAPSPGALPYASLSIQMLPPQLAVEPFSGDGSGVVEAQNMSGHVDGTEEPETPSEQPLNENERWKRTWDEGWDLEMREHRRLHSSHNSSDVRSNDKEGLENKVEGTPPPPTCPISYSLPPLPSGLVDDEGQLLGHRARQQHCATLTHQVDEGRSEPRLENAKYLPLCGSIGIYGSGEWEQKTLMRQEASSGCGVSQDETALEVIECRNARAEAMEKLPKALYGVFSDMMTNTGTPKWWRKLDCIFGTRVDEATWNKWYIEKSSVRQRCGAIVKARHFENIMLCIVLCSTVFSMYQTDDLSSPVGALDTICLFAFIGELFLRVEYYSWWTGPHAVLRNPWALLDLYLVVSHGVTTTAAVLGLKAMTNTKNVLKSARPLRIIHRVKSLQEMSGALAHSLRSCGTLLLLIAILLFAYSMVGVEVFGGMFYKCSDPNFAPKSSRYGEIDSESGVWISPPCSGNWVNPTTGNIETRTFEWENYVYHFDSIGPALLSALIVTTLDGWVGIFYAATDAYKLDHQPSENANVTAFWYFFTGIIVFGFYTTNLFVGVMFEAFLSYKNMDSTGRHISQGERRWRDYEKRLCQVSPIVAPCSCIDRPWRARIQRLVLSNGFSNAVVGVLVVNTIVLALDHRDAASWQVDAQDIFNGTFACIFVVETCLMMIGLGPRCYFSTGRQIFEFVVTGASLIDLVMEISSACPGRDIVLLRLIRSLRVVRIIRLATHIPGFDQILAACTYPARVLGNVFMMLTIAVYIFANVGVALFSNVELEVASMSLYQDFTTVWRAMQLLFIVATGEAWAEYASMVVTGSTHHKFIVMMFFVVFVIVMQFILTNLFIMVIVETFETLNAMERQDLEDALPNFQKLWSTYDPKGSGTIRHKDLFTFLLELSSPLGAEGNHPAAGRYAMMLKSAPDFDHTFKKVLVGLGAALLSNEKHALGKDYYRPVNLRRVMATLVVQRALKRNQHRTMRRSDIVLGAQEKEGTRRPSSTWPLLSGNDRTRESALEGTGRLSSTGQSIFARQWTRVRYPRVEEKAGRIASISLPPDSEESAWLMRKFLLDLQRNNDEEEHMDYMRFETEAVQDQQVAVTAGGATSKPLHFLGSRGSTRESKEGLRIQFPTPGEKRVVDLTKKGCEEQRIGDCFDAYGIPDTDTVTAGLDGRGHGSGNHGGLQKEDEGDLNRYRGHREAKVESSLGWFRSILPDTWTGGDDKKGLDKCLSQNLTETQINPEIRGIGAVESGGASGCSSGNRGDNTELVGDYKQDEVPMTALAMWLRGHAAS